MEIRSDYCGQCGKNVPRPKNEKDEAA